MDEVKKFSGKEIEDMLSKSSPDLDKVIADIIKQRRLDRKKYLSPLEIKEMLIKQERNLRKSHFVRRMFK